MLMSEWRKAMSTICCPAYLKWQLSHAKSSMILPDHSERKHGLQCCIYCTEIRPRQLWCIIENRRRQKHNLIWTDLLQCNDRCWLVQVVCVWHTVSCVFSIFLLLSRCAVTSQDSVRRSTSPTAASISTPMCWRSASGQQREDPYSDQWRPRRSCGEWFQSSESQEHIDPELLNKTHLVKNMSLNILVLT